MTASSSPRQSWLECQLDKGMFSDEMAVTYPPHGPVISSVFVPIDFVQGKPGTKGKVRVSVLQRQGKTLVQLPSADATIIRVEETDVSESP